ncbi:MAG: hypothetical protein ACFHVJ_13835 [Aestuariibacter sp.]
MKKIYIISIFIFLVFSGAVQADGWIGQGKITTLHLRPDNQDFLIFHSVMVD